MYKYIGDSILNASFTVQVPKPLDNRTVVNNLQELYSIPAAYAYVGMTVANIDNGNIYMLVDKSKIYEKSGWRASYESIQIIACTYAEYKEWKQNTDENFQPIDESLTYIHQDTYYYIYEDSLPGGEENQEYVRRSDWADLLNVVSGKASNDGLARTNRIVQEIIDTYATLAHLQETYAPLSMFDLENEDSYIHTNFFTKLEALAKFVKFSDLNGGEDIGDDDFIFVTAARYQQDQEDLETYKLGIADELAQCLKVGEDGELDVITVSKIKSKKVNNEQLTIDVTPEGMSVNGDPFAMMSDIPEHVTLTKQEYDALVEAGTVNPDTYYHITGDDATYVLQSDLDAYYTKTGVESYIAGRVYSKALIDEIISNLTFNTPEEIANIYVTKVALEDTLADYVTIAMLNGDQGDEGSFIFVKQSDFDAYKETLNNLRQEDLLNLLLKDTDITVTSVVTSLVTDGTNELRVGNTLTFNGNEIATKDDVPKLITLTKAEYDTLVENDEVEEDVYYHITDDTDSYVLSSQLSDYYTKAGIESYIAGRNYTKAQIDEIISNLTFDSPEDIANVYVTKTSLTDTLEGYVTIAMLGGEGGDEGTFIFVKQSEYNSDKEASAQQREADLQQIEDDYIKKNSDASLNSLETETVKYELNILTISDVLKLNNQNLAFEKDVPVIRVVSQEDYEELQKDPNVYYFVYGTDPELAFVLASELENYYTKPLVESKIVEALNRYPIENELVTKEEAEQTKDELIALLLAKVQMLETLISKYHTLPTEAFAIVPDSNSDLKLAVRTDLGVPTEPIEFTPQVSQPTNQKLIVPADWEETAVITDSHGYPVGYYLTGTTTVEGVDYNIYTIQLGVDTYTITFQ